MQQKQHQIRPPADRASRHWSICSPQLNHRSSNRNCCLASLCIFVICLSHSFEVLTEVQRSLLLSLQKHLSCEFIYASNVNRRKMKGSPNTVSCFSYLFIQGIITACRHLLTPPGLRVKGYLHLEPYRQSSSTTVSQSRSCCWCAMVLEQASRL